MAIRTFRQFLSNHAPGLAVGASLLALAGCSAPTAPTAHGSDYHSEAPPPPPLMGEAPGPSTHGNSLMGGPPVDVHQGRPLEAVATRHEGVVTFRRADGVLVTTMRPIPNPEDMTRAERLRVYGERPVRAAEAAPRRVHSADARAAPAPARTPVRAQAPAPVAAAPVPAAPVAAAPVAPSRPAPATMAPAAPAPAAKAPPAGPAPTVQAPAAPAPAAAETVEAPKAGGLFSFLERFKFWDREVSVPNAEVAADKVGDLADRAATAVADAGQAIANPVFSMRNILVALAVLAGVLILAVMSRNAAAKRREAQRRRRFQTFGYGAGASAFGSEPEPAQGSSVAAPVAAAGAAATTTLVHQEDKAEESEAPKAEREPA